MTTDAPAAVGAAPGTAVRTGGPRVVILQDEIMPYRRPFYDALAARYDVCVIHSGQPSRTPASRYRERIVPQRRVGPFFLQSVDKALAAEAATAPIAAVVAIFDIRRPLTLLGAWRAPTRRRLLWGHRYSWRGLINALRDRAMQRFEGVIQYGDEDTAAMVKRGIDPDRIFVAPNTVEVPGHGDLSGAAPKDSLLFVGRLQPRKRLEELLEGFAAVVGRLPPAWRIDIVGDGAIGPDLARQAGALGIGERVFFHRGTTDPAVLRDRFARAIAYVSPDNVGLGVLHAFAHGVPVVTGAPRHDPTPGWRHGPEFANLRDRHNALIVPEPEALGAALVELAATPGLAQALGAAAYRDYAQGHTIDAMVEGFARAIDG